MSFSFSFSTLFFSLFLRGQANESRIARARDDTYTQWLPLLRAFLTPYVLPILENTTHSIIPLFFYAFSLFSPLFSFLRPLYFFLQPPIPISLFHPSFPPLFSISPFLHSLITQSLHPLSPSPPFFPSHSPSPPLPSSPRPPPPPTTPKKMFKKKTLPMHASLLSRESNS